MLTIFLEQYLLFFLPSFHFLWQASQELISKYKQSSDVFIDYSFSLADGNLVIFIFSGSLKKNHCWIYPFLKAKSAKTGTISSEKKLSAAKKYEGIPYKNPDFGWTQTACFFGTSSPDSCLMSYSSDVFVQHIYKLWQFPVIANDVALMCTVQKASRECSTSQKKKNTKIISVSTNNRVLCTTRDTQHSCGGNIARTHKTRPIPFKVCSSAFIICTCSL